MTLKKLSSKRVWSVVKTQLYQMRLLFVLAGLILLICPTLLALGEFTNRYWDQYELDAVKDYIAGYVSLVAFPVMFTLGVGMAVAQFGYLHRKQKLDYFHALPVRREEHFFGRVIAAMIALAAAGLLVWLGQIFAVGVTLGFAEPSVFAFAFGICMSTAVPCFLAYLFTTLIIVLTTTLWETVFSMLAISAFGPAVYLFSYAVITCSIPVHNDVLSADWALFLSPLCYGVRFMVELNQAHWTMQTAWVWGIVLAQIVVCFAMASSFFCRRKSEQAESGGATRFKLVVRFAAAVCVTMALSLAMLWAVNQYVGYLFGSVLGLALAWIVMELLYTRSLRGMMKSFVPNLLGYAVFVVINLLVAFGWIGIPEIPAVEDINAVAVWYGRVTHTEEISESEYFRGNYEDVYTDAETHRSISMGTFDTQLVGDGRALAELLLENQKDLYFPYLPKCWGEFTRVNPADTYDYRDVTVKLYTDGDTVRLDYEDYAQNGCMAELFDRAKAIAATEEYKMSNPSLPLMDNLSYVLYTDYEKNIVNEQYMMKDIADQEDFVRRLREAYLDDMYSVDTSRDAYYDKEYGLEYGTAEMTIVDEAVAVEMHDEYSLYFDATRSVVLQGGIVDGKYPAAGLECWLLPQFTPSYDGDLPDAEETERMGNAMYFYREDFPKTCAVLDELRTAVTE